MCSFRNNILHVLSAFEEQSEKKIDLNNGNSLNNFDQKNTKTPNLFNFQTKSLNLSNSSKVQIKMLYSLHISQQIF